MIKGLYDEVKECAGSGHSLLDLYCGVGTIGIYLADNFDDVHGIEINEDAVILCGTPRYCQLISEVAKSPIVGQKNIMYTRPSLY